MKKTIARALSEALQAHERCNDPAHKLWRDEHAARVVSLMDSAPSGSGFDAGTEIEWAHGSKRHRWHDRVLVFTTSFHAMNEGYYVEWLHYIIEVFPTFDGIDVRAILLSRGKDADPTLDVNDLKEHVEETFHEWLMSEAKE